MGDPQTINPSRLARTGLSKTTIFAALALGLALYYYSASRRRARARGERKKKKKNPARPAPFQLGEITVEELKQYDGADPKKPLLMAIKGQIYDVSESRSFYGPGGPYHLFAGKDASRALALMSFEEKDLTDDISGLGVFELEALQDWEYKFVSKYVKVGTIKKTVRVSDGAESASDRDVAKAEDGPSESGVA